MKYNHSLKPFARELRTLGTKGEAVLWKKVLKTRQMEGYQFNRQFIIGEYIVDFICRPLKLIIEIDGSSHLFKQEPDRIRQNYLENEGYFILHVSEAEVLFRLDDVIKDIYHAVKAREELMNNTI